MIQFQTKLIIEYKNIDNLECMDIVKTNLCCLQDLLDCVIW